MIRQPTPSSDALRLARLTARVDQAVALVDDAMRHHANNRQLVDLAIDVRNTLLGVPDGKR